MNETARLERTDYGWRGMFSAMASHCEVLLRDVSAGAARQLVDLVASEAWRIEQRFSRYRDDNIIARINAAEGDWVDVDDETERLLDYADTCWQLSDGLFDITSGILRRAWKFDGSDRVPDQARITPLLALIGWQRVHRQPGRLRMDAGMELDFGGIGKEYAVDRALQRLREQTETSVLVNFGGDIAAHCADARPWQIGMEGIGGQPMAGQLQLSSGALATSGDSRRYLLRDGVRYSHVLNPKTGWPVSGAPHAVTVAAAQCTLAGMLATMALLSGAQAETFLQQQQVKYWCLWGERQGATASG